MRRGEERLHEEHDESVLEDHNPKPVHPGATALPESAESSVEGKTTENFSKYREIALARENHLCLLLMWFFRVADRVKNFSQKSHL